MVILLDIDGVLVTTPVWRVVELEPDGFMKFNEKAAKNLARIIDETDASIVLTTSHRINYSLEEWKVLLNTRGIIPSSIEKVNDSSVLNHNQDRGREIEDWVSRGGYEKNYVIIDDDLSINELPAEIKSRFVQTMPMIGLDEDATVKALAILYDIE
ncbi:HAD domain-containing protein [Hymenobacter negativus]|uniref:Polynucleotide kinase n=1 Tax=Hymenobacter negativus TaxID=2795026 RepID=A0ABS3QMS1_9BACT|nr:HAD domain-containing protein [Hymenobacter negativus]MBO2012552.1 hypothetical protein [Hymenobacter negativus]